MNLNIVEGSWKQFKGKVKARWTRLNDDQRDVVADKVQDAACGVMNEEIPSRRVVLRGALAVGCGLCLPIALSGCDSKKGATPAGAPGSMADKATQATANKVSQASVEYQNQAKGEQKCSICANFIAPNSCKLVDGQISPEGWCKLWIKKD
jgi:hypothetical protein